MSTKKDEMSLKKILEIFLPKLWIILLVAVVCGAFFGVISARQQETYSSSGKYMVRKVPYDYDDSSTTGLNQNEIIAMQGMISNAKEIITTVDFCEEVQERVQRRTGTKVSVSELKSAMSVSLCNDETTCYFLKVTTTKNQLSVEIAEVAGELLSEMFKDMGYAIAVDRIDTPRPAEAANSKNTARNAIIGFAIGAVVCAIVVFVFSKFDVVVRSKEKLESSFDLPILGVIPRPESNKQGGKEK